MYTRQNKRVLSKTEREFLLLLRDRRNEPRGTKFRCRSVEAILEFSDDHHAFRTRDSSSALAAKGRWGGREVGVLGCCGHLSVLLAVLPVSNVLPPVRPRVRSLQRRGMGNVQRGTPGMCDQRVPGWRASNRNVLSSGQSDLRQ